MTSTKTLPAALRALAILSAIFLLSAGCWMFREIDACETDRDCAEGEVCYNSSGILVCLPEAFLAETDDRDAGAEDAPRSDSNDLTEDTRPGGDASDAPATDDIGQDDSVAGDLAAEVTEDLGRDLDDDARLDDLVRPDDTGGTDSAGDVGPCDGGIVNDCGGCGVLSDEPGEACGPCGLDEYICSGGEAVTCDGDTTNDCGGCAALAGVPDQVCSCGGLGDAVWSCDGTEAVVCSDDNDTFETAEFLGNVDETDEITVTRFLDGEADVDIYRVDIAQDLPSQTIRVGVGFERLPDSESPSYSIQYDLDAFYRYFDVRGANILTYSCGFNTCIFWNDSAEDVGAASCETGTPSFNPTQDLYGCSGVGPGSTFSPPFDLAGGDSIDAIDDNAGDNTDDRGIAYVVVSTSSNEAPEGCEAYTFTVSF